jgi:excisionase family DNA binding protein
VGTVAKRSRSGWVGRQAGDRLLTVAEVAGTMRVSNMTVYRLIKNGDLPALRVGKNYRIRESDVDVFLSNRSVQVEGA